MNYREHKNLWAKCRRCDLCKVRTKVVLARGNIPAAILLVGEAPGVSEDLLGTPFKGPAGKLLSSMLKQAKVTDFALTNLVACIPKQDGNKLGEPPKKAVKACEKRLRQFVELVHPQVIVCVGKLASRHLRPYYTGKIELVDIIHPAAILRMDVAQQGLAYQRAVVRLCDTAERL